MITTEIPSEDLSFLWNIFDVSTPYWFWGSSNTPGSITFRIRHTGSVLFDNTNYVAGHGQNELWQKDIQQRPALSQNNCHHSKHYDAV